MKDDLGTIDHHLSMKLTRFFMKCVGMWYSESYRDEIISEILLLFNFINMIIAVVIEGIDAICSWKDFHRFIFVIPATVVVILELFRLSLFMINRNEVLKLNSYTDSTFWKVEYEQEEIKILDRSNKEAMTMTLIYFIGSQIVIWQYLTMPLLDNMGRNESDRELPFKIWYTFSFSKLTVTPFFEILYIAETAAAFSTLVCSTTFSCFLFTLNLYTAAQFKLLQRKLTNSCPIVTSDNIILQAFDRSTMKECFKKFQDCIKQHQVLIKYIDRLEKLYSPIMLGEAFATVTKVSALGFQVLLGLDGPILPLLRSIQFLIFATMELFLFSYSCHEISTESLEVAPAAYNACWYCLACAQHGSAYRQSMLILVERARRPCILTLGKFAPMSLDTFAGVVRKAMSFFTVLRQMEFDIE